MNFFRRNWLSIILTLIVSFYLTYLVDIYTLNTFLKRAFIFGYFVVLCSAAVHFRRRIFKQRMTKSKLLFSVAAAAVCFFIFQNSFLPHCQEITIWLTSTGQSTERSIGEIWLVSADIDGSETALQQLRIEENENWTYQSEYDDYVFFPSEEIEENRLALRMVAEEISLSFASNDWSGIVSISDSLGNSTVFDLYTNDPQRPSVEYRVSCYVERSWPQTILYGLGILTLLSFGFLICFEWISIRYPTWEQRAKIAPVLCAAAHWLITFASDGFVFEQSGNMARQAVLKFVFLIICMGLWTLVFRIAGRIREGDTRTRKSVQFFIGYWLLCTFIMICIWPGNWIWDDIFVFEAAVKWEFEPWQHIITSFFYIFSLMLIPTAAGIVIVQYTIVAAVFGWIQGSIYEILQNKKLIIFTMLPFFLPPVLAHIFYPMRLVLYTFIELSFLYLMKVADKKKNITVAWLFIFTALMVLLISWRSEGIIFILVAPAALVFCLKDRRKTIGITVAALCISFFFIAAQNWYLGINKDYYAVTAYIESMDDLVKYENQTEPDSNILKDLDEKMDLQILLESDTGENSFWNGAFLELRTNGEYDSIRTDFESVK